MGLREKAASFMATVTGKSSEVSEQDQMILDSLTQHDGVTAKAAEAAREEFSTRELTKKEQQLIMRAGIRSAGGQKILNFLARGTRVQNTPAANMVLGQFSGLY